MTKVFSLWPAPSVQEPPPGHAGPLPRWAHRARRAGWPSSLPSHVALAVIPILLALLAGAAAAIAVVHGGVWAGLVAALLGGGTLLAGVKLCARLQEARTGYEALFERSGVSLWREDWFPVAEAILALRRAGIHDMQAYFTTHPDRARQLRRQVRIKDVNRFTVTMMGAPGKEAFIGPLDRILPNTDQTFLQWLVAISAGERLYRSEAHITRPDGSELECLFAADLPDTLEGFRDIVVTAVDITAYKAVQSRLLQAEAEIARAARVTTAGTLTATIAHEVNSPLAAIVGHAEACRRWLARAEPDLAEARHALEHVVRDSIRARDVVTRLRSFIGNAARRSEAVDLVQVTREAILLIERELRASGASVHFDAGGGLPLVTADPVQIQQVVVNLMLNGAQAMIGQPGPHDLTVRLSRSDEGVQVEVRDGGPGIDASHLPRVFEPFYSTKPDGMGMGLAICRNCVEAHGGRLWAENASPRGAVFRFVLPTVEQQ
ncbi:sensor histidine kinase [Roseomonas populi]|uniref:histidine kinase n=1 Tax=Roseomonas populi TaxID=3121582 RepID=A0ABT1X2P4_9PROT|nr:PAS domain-containing sensor histidine kinase [Roseomonas pecuniae]MCR0982347.1 ATP-binding protein [Roseomonas pecuniae]